MLNTFNYGMKYNMENKKKVGCVIVTFNPDIKHILKLVNILIEDGELEVIVIDNGSNNKNELVKLNGICSLICLEKNYGIAFAQNVGIKKCFEYHLDYIVFFDQDSFVANDYVHKLKNEMIVLESRSNVATLGPVFKDSRYGFFYDVIKLNSFGIRKKIKGSDISGFQEVSFIISSGSIVSRKAFELVGLMDEDLFIDYVDTEWCLRAVNKNLKVFVTGDVLMSHAIGDKFLKFMKYNIPVHSSFRRYYRIRNALYFFRMPHVPVIMKLRDVIYNTIHQGIIILKSEDKLNNFSVYFKAVKDGLRYILTHKRR